MDTSEKNERISANIGVLPVTGSFWDNLRNALSNTPFDSLVLFVARAADAPEVFEEIEQFWSSIHDVTGDRVLFALLDGTHHAKYSHTGFWSDMALSDSYPTAHWQRQHSLAITRIRQKLHISEGQVPAILVASKKNDIAYTIPFSFIKTHFQGKLYLFLKSMVTDELALYRKVEEEARKILYRPSIRLPTLCIDASRRFSLPSIDISFQLEPQKAAFYALLLRRPDGIRYSDLDQHRDMLIDLYIQMAGTRSEAVSEKKALSYIDSLLHDPEYPVQCKSKINAAIRKAFQATSHDATPYLIDTDRKEKTASALLLVPIARWPQQIVWQGFKKND